uniref:Putative secreted protein n=1 Tax=Ixodes ricinus TaxID=34613 RepID=A0A6B0UV88_IXORI
MVSTTFWGCPMMRMRTCPLISFSSLHTWAMASPLPHPMYKHRWAMASPLQHPTRKHRITLGPISRLLATSCRLMLMATELHCTNPLHEILPMAWAPRSKPVMNTAKTQLTVTAVAVMLGARLLLFHSTCLLCSSFPRNLHLISLTTTFSSR